MRKKVSRKERWRVHNNWHQMLMGIRTVAEFQDLQPEKLNYSTLRKIKIKALNFFVAPFDSFPHWLSCKSSELSLCLSLEKGETNKQTTLP